MNEMNNGENLNNQNIEQQNMNQNNVAEPVQQQYVQPTEPVNNQEPPKKEEKKSYCGLLIVFMVISLLLAGYIVYDKCLKKEENRISNNSNEPNDTTIDKEDTELPKEKEFEYENYTIKLRQKIDNIGNLYAIDIKSADDTTYDIYGRYTDETSVKIATITGKGNAGFEYRSLDVDNNRLYFIINSKILGVGKIFELNFIDLTSLAKGATTLDDFNKVYKDNNYWKVNEKEAYSSGQIYVKDNSIFYSSFVDGSVRKFNMNTNADEIVVKKVNWFDFFVDKKNNYIFYQNDENKLYISNLAGQNAICLETAEYGGSDFWVNAYYNDMPVFGFSADCYDCMDLYAYDINNNKFIKVQELATSINIKYNKIDMNIKRDSNLINTFFIAQSIK